MLWQVISDDDDCRAVTGVVFQLTPAVLRAGSFTYPLQHEGMGLRFTDITVPKGSTINEAYLIVTAMTSDTDAVSSRISAEDVDNAPDFSGETLGTLMTRWAGRTAARVDWDFLVTDVWVLDTEYNSPEIKTVIQEIVDRAGWASGNAIVIFWDDWEMRSASGASKERQTYPYNISAAKAVQLYIDYTPPPAGMVGMNPAFWEVLVG